jgi:hypothetical protein
MEQSPSLESLSRPSTQEISHFVLGIIAEPIQIRLLKVSSNLHFVQQWFVVK